MIYLIQAGVGGPLKIGCAAEPRKRLSDLQTGSPEPLTLVLAILGGLREERELHERFAASHRRGEWFNPTKEVLAFIASYEGRYTRQWEDISAIEPDLERLAVEAWRHFQLHRDDVEYCAVDAFYGNGGHRTPWRPSFKDRVGALAGWTARNEVLRTMDDYDIAYDVILFRLGPCRACACEREADESLADYLERRYGA